MDKVHIKKKYRAGDAGNSTLCPDALHRAVSEPVSGYAGSQDDGADGLRFFGTGAEGQGHRVPIRRTGDRHAAETIFQHGDRGLLGSLVSKRTAKQKGGRVRI